MKYFFVEDKKECHICYETFNESFRCKRCTFSCCPKCFNNFFLTDKNNCPICRY